jgi:hypothetical protein
MRHPYFKECREADSRKAAQQTAPPVSNSTSAPAPVAQQSVIDGSSKPVDQKVLSKSDPAAVKGLPTIGGSSNNVAQLTGNSDSNSVSGLNGSKILAPKANTIQAVSQQIPSVQTNTLPPIVSTGNNQTTNQKYFYTDGNRNNVASIDNASAKGNTIAPIQVQRKKKKVCSERF